jgi:hypothetical protein
MTEINNQEKNHQYYLDKIYKVDHKVYYRMGKYTQFTIDLVEKIREELEQSKEEHSPEGNNERPLSLDTLLGALSYNVSNALEICDKTLNDYKILQELEKILADKN